MSGDARCKSRGTSPHYKMAPYEILDVELDTQCMTVCCSTQDSQVPMCKEHDVPAFMRHNPFVLYGYRSTLPFSLCIKRIIYVCVSSLFIWSNETINIWSHLFGFFLFFAIMMWEIYVLSLDDQITVLDKSMLTAGLVCFQFCMLCSSGYHLFRCHSERASDRWLALDLTGISVGLLGCYLPSIHLAFYCLSVWRDVYLLVIGCLFASVFYWQTRPRLLSSRFVRARQILYISLTACGIVPACHWVYLHGLNSNIVQLFAPKILVLYVLALLAFCFYATQVPERFFPGKFDYIGASHQCWHVVVVVMFFWWHKSGKELLLYRMTHPCHLN